MFQLGTCAFDPVRQLLCDAGGATLDLRAQALKVLQELIKAEGAVVAKAQLIEAVWPDVAVTDDSLVQCIVEIRNAIGDAAHDIVKTEHRRGYRLVMQAAPERTPVRLERRQPPPERVNGFDAHAAPAIAVMAFTALEADERSERLAQAFAGDLIAELSRQKGLRVIGRFSSFSLRGQGMSAKEVCQKLNAQYLVAGQVQFSETRIVWSLEMTDGPSDEIVWSERKQVSFADMEGETAALLTRIASSINANFVMFSYRKTLAQAPESLNAYDLCSRAMATMLRTTVESTREAQQLAAQAVQTYPQYARAWRTLAHSHSWDMVFCHTGQWSEFNVGQALGEVHRAIELDASQAAAFYTLSQLLTVNGQHQEALQAARQSLALAPGDQSALQFHSLALFFGGHIEESRAASEELLALTPIRQSHFLYSCGRTLLALGEHDAAILELQDSVAISPGNTQGRMALVVALHETGKLPQANEHFKALLAHSNGFDDNYFGLRWNAIPEVRERFVKALRGHGLQAASTVRQTRIRLVTPGS